MTSNPVEPSDESLLRDFVAGRREALGVLAARYERSLLGAALGLLHGDRVLAADAVQETWIRVIRFGASFQGASSAKTWLYRILINQCRAMLLARRAAGAADIPDDADRNATNPADKSDASERADRLRRLVSRLDSDQQAVLLLCYHEGMTHEEAAGVLGLPLGTLKSRLHGALRALRERLGAREAV